MYCPSCDKSYGAVHSRCPECHSWLKVSAPASSRAKSVKAAASAAGSGGISTLDKEGGIAPAWPEPPSAGASSIGEWPTSTGSDSWAGALPSGATKDPAPVAEGGGAWGGAGGGWGGASSSDSWGGADLAAKAPPAPTASPASPAPSSEGWLSGGAGAGADWGGGAAPNGPSAGLAAPTSSPAPVAPLSVPVSDDSWGGGGGSTFGGAKAPVPPVAGATDSSWAGAAGSSGGFKTPSLGATGAGPAAGTDAGWGGAATGPSGTVGGGALGAGALGAAPAEDGWGGGGGSTFGSGSTFGGSTSTPKAAMPANSQGWLGDDASGEETSAGWLGDERTAKVGGAAPESDGWLGGAAAAKAPSMTEMVDRAINVEEADDFVDDSWVDEEVGQGEFDDLEVPEYVPPTPEVGGAFIKMLLVAMLVLLVGGGVMFMNQEKKTPEQIKAEEKAKELEFARSSVESGKNYIKNGQALLAVGPLEAALTALKTNGADGKEILDTKALLARALMKAKPPQYQEAYEHWAGLAKSGDAEYKKEAKAQMAETSKLLRAEALAKLTEAAGYVAAGESSSVLTLGKDALKIFEAHAGTATQKGKAWGVIGRGYLNGKEYGKAKEALKKALALNPAGGYGADLAKIADLTAPASYYSGGGGYTETVQQGPRPRPVRVEASIGDGPGYSQRRVSGGGGRRRTTRTSSGGSTESAPAASSAPRTKAIPAFQRAQQPRGPRPGQRGVVNSY